MDEAAWERVGATLRGGLGVCHPTETLYGFGALWDDAAGDAAVRRMKGRGDDRPFLVLVPDGRWLGRWSSAASPLAGDLARRFWPGAVTLVFRASHAVPRHLLSAEGTVAIRCSSDPIVAELVARFGPITSTSANRTGEPPPTGPDDVQWHGPGPGVAIDDGRRAGAPSTVVAVGSAGWRLVRAGAVDPAWISGAVGPPTTAGEPA